MKFVYMVALLAWLSNGEGTDDSGRFADTTLSACHARSQAFSKKHDTPVQICIRISDKGYRIISNGEVEFDFTEGAYKVEVSDSDEKIQRLLKALKAIGRLHRGKTKDSQRVRAIIKKARR